MMQQGELSPRDTIEDKVFYFTFLKRNLTEQTFVYTMHNQTTAYQLEQ